MGVPREEFCIQVEDLEDGLQLVRLVRGGRHRGGMAEARITFSGGLDIAVAQELRLKVMFHVFSMLDGRVPLDIE